MTPVKASGWLNTPLTDEERQVLLRSGIVPINDAFYPYFDVIAPYELYWGGRGSSKSHFVARKILNQCLTKDYVRGIYCRKHAVDIRESQYDLFKQIATDYGISRYFTFYESTMKIVCKHKGNTLIARGMDEVDNTKSINDPNLVWWEELPEFDQEDFETMTAGLRTTKGEIQTICTFNPTSETNWVRTFFFDKDDKYKLGAEFEGSICLRSTLEDNLMIDREAYRKRLELLYRKNPNGLRVNLRGDWGLTENNDPWLYGFDKKTHVRELPFLPSYPVYLSFDFNNSPFTAEAFQKSDVMGTPNSFCHFIHEFSGDIKIESMCQQIKTQFPGSILFVTGDRSGDNDDVGRNQTNYQIIQSKLGLSDKQMHLNTSNLTHSDSRLLCNVLFNEYPNVFISPKCKQLVEDCEKATVDLKSATASALLKDRKDYKMDAFDAMRYGFQTYFNKFAKETYFRLHK